MEKELKELLLKDLYGRLLYGVKVNHFGNVTDLLGISFGDMAQVGYDINDYEDTVIEDIRPYLRPISSMSEEEKKRYKTLLSENKLYGGLGIKLIDWLNAHHFDYRGLIERGLVLVAPKGMYDLKKK